jgi:photosystem II stability/assembly factor-like uncharacterized protein
MSNNYCLPFLYIIILFSLSGCESKNSDINTMTSNKIITSTKTTSYNPTRTATHTLTSTLSITPTQTMTSSPTQVETAKVIENRLISSITMIDSNNGWGQLSDGRVIRTEDGGITWHDVSPFVKWDTKIVKILNDTTIWIVEDYKIYRTIDKGITWKQMNADSNAFTSVDFTELNTGFMVSALYTGSTATYYLARSMDGGSTWNNLQIKTNPPHAPIVIKGIILSHEYDNIYFDLGKILITYGLLQNNELTIDYSSDYGNTWSTQSIPVNMLGIQTRNIYSVPQFINEKNGILESIVIGGDNIHMTYLREIILSTDTGGETWSIPIELPSEYIGNYIKYLSETTLFMGCKNQLCFSYDMGRHWETVTSNILFESQPQFFFLDKYIGWALEKGPDLNRLYITEDGGKNWKELDYKIS